MNLASLYTHRYLPFIKRRLKVKTVAEYDRLAQTLVLPAFGDMRIDRITLSVVEEWHAGQAAKVQANRALALTSAILGFAAKRDLLAANPCRGVHRNRERNRETFYLPDEAQAIVQAALAFPDIRGKYIALVLLTGARPSELLKSAVSWRYGAVLQLPDSKTGARPSELLNSAVSWRYGAVLQLPDSKVGARTVYLSPAASAILDALPSSSGGRYFPDGMDLRRAWGRILRAAGVRPARMYDLRHTFASSALAAGEPLSVVGLMLGHRKAQTTMRYVHLAPDTGLRAAAAAAERMGVK